MGFTTTARNIHLKKERGSWLLLAILQTGKGSDENADAIDLDEHLQNFHGRFLFAPQDVGGWVSSSQGDPQLLDGGATLQAQFATGQADPAFASATIDIDRCISNDGGFFKWNKQ
jgi:hypothetical protein